MVERVIDFLLLIIFLFVGESIVIFGSLVDIIHSFLNFVDIGVRDCDIADILWEKDLILLLVDFFYVNIIVPWVFKCCFHLEFVHIIEVDLAFLIYEKFTHKQIYSTLSYSYFSS